MDWLWDGFNAVVLSYGQARAGKTTLLVGNGAPLTDTPGESSQRAESLLRGSAEQVGIRDGEQVKQRRRGDEEGLLKDILRDIFDKAAAAGSADAASPVPVASQEKQLSPTTGEPPYETLNPLAGSWSPSRHANDSPGFDVCPGGIGTLLGTQEATSHGAGTATLQTSLSGIDSERSEGGKDGDAEPVATADRIYGSESRNQTGKQRSRCSTSGKSGLRAVVALSAWEVAGKHVTDLFVDPSPDSGSTGGSSNRRKNTMGNSSSSIEVDDKVTRGRGKRSRSRNRSNKNRTAGSDCSRGGGNQGGGRRNSRGRSGSDDSSSTGAGWPSGYPEGFLSVRVPNLTTAMELVDAAQNRCSACRRQRATATSEAGKGSRGNGGGGKTGGAAAAESTAAAANSSHVFFRVVVYNIHVETVSTLHVVDLAGGWEVRT